MTYPKPETLEFCDMIVAGPNPPGWKASNNLGPIMVVSVGGVPAYAELRSERLTPGELATAGTPAGSSWRMYRGRWPLQYTNTVVAAAWATWAVIENRVIPPAPPNPAFDRHRVYLIDDPIAVAATLHKVALWVRGDNTVQTIEISPGQSKYCETELLAGGGQRFKPKSVPQPPPQPPDHPAVPAADDGTFITDLIAFANGKGFNLITNT